MNAEMKKDFVARVSQANRTQLTVVVFDVILVQLKEASLMTSREQTEERNEALKMAQQFVGELLDSLDHNYGIAHKLRPIYVFVNKEIIYSILSGNIEKLPQIIEIMRKLRDSFEQVSRQDFSEPLMENTQKIYTGLTYGKGTLNETAVDVNQVRRGFMA